MNPGWIITHDSIALPNHPAGTNLNAKGIIGPSSYEGDTNAAALPIRFRMLDDDGNLYYAGRMNEDAMRTFGEGDPLYCFGLPNAGAAWLLYRDDEGEWRRV